MRAAQIQIQKAVCSYKLCFRGKSALFDNLANQFVKLVGMRRGRDCYGLAEVFKASRRQRQ